jgi:hypothetical protein
MGSVPAAKAGPAPKPGCGQATADTPWLEVDARALVSSADLVYQSPAPDSLAGLPIGNGRMGTLVWTRPSEVCLQINRVDVMATGKHHAGTFCDAVDQRWGACAQVVIDLGGQPLAAGPAFCQRLSLYQAEVTIAGEGVHVRCRVSATTDVLALEIDDRRPEPQPLRLTLSMWPAPEQVSGAHVTSHSLAGSPDTPVVVQRYREGDHHCASAVAACLGPDGVQGPPAGALARTLVAPARPGQRTILIASAASWAPHEDVDQTALRALGAARRRTDDALRQEHERWWQDFWSRTFVQATSDDGVAAFMQRVRYLHLYYMASSSRGALPPKWNGSLFITDAEARSWGSQFWVWTMEMPYFALLAADAIELTAPFFDMYVRQLPDCEQAARQRWGSRGAFFPETTPFDGPIVLPDETVPEFRAVFTGRQDPKAISPRLRAACGFESHLFCSTHSPVTKQYTWISHVASSGSELAVHAWWRYRCTGDTAWLRTHAYPLLRGTAEFYRHLVTRGDDGLYHLHGTHAHEDFWGVTDSIMDLAALRGTLPLARRAAEILGVDAELRLAWQDLLTHLAPYPMGRDPASRALTDGALADDAWAAGHLGEVNDGHRNSEDVWLNPVFPFEDWTLETRSAELDRIVQRTLDLAHRHQAVLRGEALNTAIRTPVAVVRAGRGEELPILLASYYAAFSPLPNGLSLFEGRHDPSIEHLGLLSMVLQEALLQSVAPRPGEPEVICVFPAWPRAWAGSFRLLARGGFLVTAASDADGVAFVEIESRLGEVCRLRNPWTCACHLHDQGQVAAPDDRAPDADPASGAGAAARVAAAAGEAPSDAPVRRRHQGNDLAPDLCGPVLVFATRPGHRYRLLPAGASAPVPRRIAPPPDVAPVHFLLARPGTTPAEGRLGTGR